MSHIDFRGTLLDVLSQDKEVQNKVIEIVRTTQLVQQEDKEQMQNEPLQEVPDLETENRRLKGVLEEALDEIRSLKGIVSALKSLNTTLEQEKQSVEQERNRVQEANYQLEQERNRVQEANYQLEQERNRLQETTNSLRGQVEQLNCQCSSLERTKTLLEEEKETLAKEKRKLNIELKGYQADFDSIRQYYADYMQLDESIRQNLKTVIKDDHIMRFYSSGVQWENIEALWEWLSYQLDTLSSNDREVLICMFYYFFEQYNNAMGDYELLEVQIGESFDEELHTRASQSNVAGSISEVLLKGYKRKRTQKLVKKTIVRV